ncbi:MAG: hypothetical protein AAB560_00175 [Patescibacteria group bacterium]
MRRGELVRRGIRSLTDEEFDKLFRNLGNDLEVIKDLRSQLCVLSSDAVRAKSIYQDFDWDFYERLREFSSCVAYVYNAMLSEEQRLLKEDRERKSRSKVSS